MAFRVGEGNIDLSIDRHSPAYVITGGERGIGRVKRQLIKGVQIHLQEIGGMWGLISMEVHPESDAG